jgi:1,2-diacylglycerol 3-alpha-glucosyltransferase
MKILHIDFTGPFTEEMSYQENLIPKYQVRDGHEVIIITNCFEWNNSGVEVYTPPVDKLMRNGVRLIRVNYHKIICDYITFKIRKFDGVYNLLELISPEIIFFHGPQTIELLTIIKYIKKFPRIRLYIDNHADFLNSASNFLSLWFLHKLLWRYVTKKAEPYTTRFYGVLPSRVEFLINIYKVDRKRCELLLMGVDDEKVNYVKNFNIRNKIRTDFGFTDDDFVIITGGKIDATKTQTLLLLNALQTIKAPNVKLLIFGSIVKELKELILKFVDNEKIFYLGWITSDEIYNFLSSCDLAVFPGKHSVIWEQSVGMGIPCIFRYWEGFDHIDLGGNCRFIYEDKVSEISRVLEEIINNPIDYQKMKRVAEENGLKKFSYREISRKAVEA